ncbi:MAG: zf-HC2 domain-containing protein [Pyrinomonadaceae bacterium]|nr:zf-HC2 domain-containing protein [Pyrinomonadaceae bacterium]
MLCADFEVRLTDYLDGALDAMENRAFAEHAMRCPVCHELLSEVKNTLQACRVAEAPAPSREMEARILNVTVPEVAMTCEEFEDYLTDYLDGFLPAPLFHRWERHAALCENCTELPGSVVRAIGACYTYINEEHAVPFGLHDRILQATLGTTEAEEIRAPLGARIAARLRMWLDPIVSPQLATVATMLLVAVLVLTSTVSADGSISGMYRAGVKLVGQSYDQSAPATRGTSLTDDLKQLANGVTAAFSHRQNNNSTEQQNKQKDAGSAK